MKIKNRTISSKEAPLIIAELGINHGGDLLVAEQMVKIAAFEFEKVLGKTIKRDIAKNTQLKWSDLD